MYMASHQTLAKPEPSMAAAVYNLQRAQSHELVLDNYAGQPLDQDFWQPQWDADEAGAGPTCDAGPACLDAYDDEEEGVGVLDTPAIPEVDEALSTRYAAMLVDRNETELFDRYNSAPTDKYEAELCRVLAGAFSGCFAGQDDLARLGSKQMMQQVAENCNYAVESVVRIMNKPHHSMQQAFAKNYRLDATRTVYHGTSEEGATSITAVGFKGAAGRRAKFGRGMYSSPIVWEALGYAKPFRDVLQVLFVCELLQGPSAQGSEDQVDFGVDAFGREVLTLTNPAATILCASKENQMLATHRIAMRYMFEAPFVARHRECIRVVHADIALIIKQAKENAVAYPTPNPAAAVAALATATASALKLQLRYVTGLQGSSTAPAPPAYAAPPAHPTQNFTDALHTGFRVGNKVIVSDTRKAYREFKGQPGLICRIVKAHYFLICVRMDSFSLRMAVQRMNALPVKKARSPFLRHDEDDLVVLKAGQLVMHQMDLAIQAAQVAPDRLLGKRKPPLRERRAAARRNRAARRSRLFRFGGALPSGARLRRFPHPWNLPDTRNHLAAVVGQSQRLGRVLLLREAILSCCVLGGH